MLQLLTQLCMLSNQMNTHCSMFILCTYAWDCLSMIKHSTLGLFCCTRLWIPIAKMACLSAEERQSADWWVLFLCAHICTLCACVCVCVCVCVYSCGICICVCELVVFLSELISSYPPPTPPQHAVNRVSATRWEMAQLSPAGEIWAGMHHCFFPTECVCACVRVCVCLWVRGGVCECERSEHNCLSSAHSLWCPLNAQGIVPVYVFIHRHVYIATEV